MAGKGSRPSGSLGITHGNPRVRLRRQGKTLRRPKGPSERVAVALRKAVAAQLSGCFLQAGGAWGPRSRVLVRTPLRTASKVKAFTEGGRRNGLSR